MKIKPIIFAFFLLTVFSCKTSLHVSKVTTEKNISINNDISEDQKMTQFISPYKKSLEGKMNTKIAYTPIDLTKKGDNSNLGNLLADYTFDGASEWGKKNGISKIDGAVINIGGIRSTIGAGDILTKHVYEVMPFENEIVIVKMKGADLQGIFDYYAKKQKNNPVSHFNIEVDAGKITKQLVDGKNLDPNKIYYIATSDYLALGGDGMDFFNKGEMIMTGIKMRDLFLEKFKQNSEIAAPTDVRLVFKNKIADNDE